MLLYHFTTSWCVGNKDVPDSGTIWRDGIKPGTPPEAGYEPGKSGRAPNIMPSDCVFLTRETFPDGWWVQYGKPTAPEVRLTVRLPTSDKRLVKYERWLRDKTWIDEATGESASWVRDEFMSDLDKINSAWRLWYCYFGTIPLDRIKGMRTYKRIDETTAVEGDNEATVPDK